MPANSFPRVLLPAPFSPQSAWHEPTPMSNVTSSSATTPGKRLVIDRKLTAIDSMNARLGSSETSVRQLQVRLGHVGEAPVAKLASPGAEILLGHAHQLHRNDF